MIRLIRKIRNRIWRKRLERDIRKHCTVDDLRRMNQFQQWFEMTRKYD